IFHLLHIFAHQTAQDHRLTVPHTDIRGHLARAENRLVDHVLGKKNLAWLEEPGYWIERRTRIYSEDRTAVIDEAFELDDLRHQVQVDRHAVRAYYRFHLQGHACISSFEGLRRGRCHDRNCNRSNSATSTRNTRNLWRRKRGRITEFSHDFDGGALAALGGHFRCREKIDTFSLAEPPKHDLELRIGENTSQTKNSWRYSGASQ